MPDEVATTVLDRFTEVGLIDDAGYAASYVESRHAGRGLGRRALLAELHAKGIESRTAHEAVEAIDADAEASRARALVERRLPSIRGLDREAKVRRLAGMLARKGYASGLAFRVVNEALAAEGHDPLGEPAPDW